MSKEVICPLAQQGKCPQLAIKCGHREKHEPKSSCKLSSNGHYSCGAGPCVKVSTDKVIPYVEIPCKWEDMYWEDVAGDGRGSMQICDCKYDGDKETGDTCGPTCPAYEPHVEPPKEQGEIIRRKIAGCGDCPEKLSHHCWNCGHVAGEDKAVQSERQRIIGEVGFLIEKFIGYYASGDEIQQRVVAHIKEHWEALKSEISSGQPVPDRWDEAVDKVLEIIDQYPFMVAMLESQVRALKTGGVGK